MCFEQALTVNRPFSFSPDSAPLGVFSGAWVSSASTTYCGPSSTRMKPDLGHGPGGQRHLAELHRDVLQREEVHGERPVGDRHPAGLLGVGGDRVDGDHDALDVGRGRVDQLRWRACRCPSWTAPQAARASAAVASIGRTKREDITDSREGPGRGPCAAGPVCSRLPAHWNPGFPGCARPARPRCSEGRRVRRCPAPGAIRRHPRGECDRPRGVPFGAVAVPDGTAWPGDVETP